MENKTLSYKTVGTLLLIIVVLAVWQSYSSKNHSTEETEEMAQNTPAEGEGQMDTAATTATTTQTTTPDTTEPGTLLTTKIYSNARYQFQFSYPSDWKRTDVAAFGEYKDALVFVRVLDETAIATKVSLDSAALTQAVTDRALVIRIFENETLNSITSRLYGSGVVVSQIKINGKNVTKIVQSKSTDTANWKGGSTEAYFYKNSLGQSILIEAKYGSAEPRTDGLLKAMLDSVIASFKLVTI